MGIGNDELDATQTAPGQAAQEVRLERFSFGKTLGHAKNFAHAVGIDGHSDYYCYRYHPSGLARFNASGDDPQVGPVTLDGPVQEGLHTLIDFLAQPRNLALGHTSHAHGFHQFIDRTR